MLRQCCERAAIFRVVSVNRIVVEPGTNEIVVARVVQIGALESWRRLVIHPQRLDPGVADVSRVRRARHARHDSLPRVYPVRVNLRWAAVARGEELPLLQSEMRELINSDEKKLRALVLINIVLVAAVAETRGRSVFPGNDMLRCVVTLVHHAGHVPPEVTEQRRFQLRICPPKKQSVTARNFARLADCFPQERFCFSRTCRAAKKPVLCLRLVKFLLPGERSIAVAKGLRALPCCPCIEHSQSEPHPSPTARAVSSPHKTPRRRQSERQRRASGADSKPLRQPRRLRLRFALLPR